MGTLRPSRRRFVAALGALPLALSGCFRLPQQLTAATATPRGPRPLSVVRAHVAAYSDGEERRLAAALELVPPEWRGMFEVAPLRFGADAAEQIPGDYSAALAARQGERPPDLVMTPPWAVDTLVRAGVLRDLTHLLARERWFDRAAYVGNVLATGRVGGVQGALPLDAGGEVLLYHEASFASAGLPPPRPGWTWADLTAAAARLTGPRGGGGRRWGFYVSHHSPSIWTLAWQHGARIVGDDGRIDVQERGTIRALELLAELVERDRVAEPQADRGGTGGPRHLMGAFTSGQAAMGAVIANDTVPWRDHTDMRVAEMPTPEQRVVFGDVTSLLGIPQAAPDVDRSVEGLRLLVEANHKVRFAATRQSEAELRRAEPSLTAEDAAAIGRAFASARFLPGDVPYFTVAAPIALELVRPVVLGQKHPLKAAADAQELADRGAMRR